MNPNQQSVSLGQFLKQERERSGLTLEQVASATKISLHALQLIEADDYRNLPAKPFVRGFIISYARFIGLDPKEILTRYQGFIEEKIQERLSRESGHSGYAFEKRDSDYSRKILIVALSSFLVIGLLLVMFVKPHKRKKHSKYIEEFKTLPTVQPQATPTLASVPNALRTLATPTPTSTGPTPTAIPSPASVLTPSKTPILTQSPTTLATRTEAIETPVGPTPLPDPLDSGVNLKPHEIKEKIIFKAKRDLWIRYQADDRPLRRIILRSGSVLVLRGANLVKAELSDKTAAQISRNGKMIYDPTPRTDDAPIEPISFVFPEDRDTTKGNPFASEPPLPREAPPPKPQPTKSPNH
jgi:cytoskeletal protein RodZ